MSSLPARLPAPALDIHPASAMALLSIQRSRFRPRRAVASGAFGFALLLSSVAGLQAQQAIAEPRDTGSVRETSPAQPRGISHAADFPKAGAFEGPLDPPAVSMERAATDFGKVKAGNISKPVAVTFTFKRSTTLGSIDVVTKGATDLDFADAHTGTCTAGTSYSVGNTCTVLATFKPRYAGARDGAVILRDEDGKPLGVHPLFATGLAPQIAFQPPVASTPAIGTLTDPVALAVDSSENLYVADDGSAPTPAAIYKETLQPGGGYVQTTIGSGWSSPSGITVDGSGNVYVTDSGTGDVYKETPSGNTYTQSLVASGFVNPNGVAVSGLGDIFVVDFGPAVGENGAVYRISDLGAPAASQSEIDSGGTPNPAAITADGSGHVFVGTWGAYLSCPGVNCANPIPSYVAEFTPIPGSPGQYSETWFDTIFPTISYASTVSAIALDPAGDIYVTDSSLGLGYGGGVFEYSPGGAALTTLYSNNHEAQGLALDGNGNVFFTDIGTDGFSNYPPQLYLLDMADAPTLTFPEFTVGSSDPVQTVTIANIGNSPLDLSIPASGVNPSISNGYMLDSTSAGTCPSVPSSASSAGTLAPATSCTLPVTFDPPSPGSYPGQLVLKDNNMLPPGQSGATQTIQLQGIEAGVTVRFVVSAPATADQGQMVNVTVTAVDSFGDITPAYAGTVHFTSSDPKAMLPADTTLTNGAGTVAATPYSLGAQTITATDTVKGSIAGISGSITVSPAHLIVSAPASVEPGDPFSPTITAVDIHGNTLTGYDGTVQLASSDPLAWFQVPTVTLSNGTASFSVVLYTLGPQTFTATDTVASNITGTSGTVTVGQQHLVLSAPSSAVAGQAFTFTVTAVDNHGNTVTSYSDGVQFTGTDPAAEEPPYSYLTNGTGTFSATLFTGGPQTISASDPSDTSITGTSGNINVSLQNLVVTTHQDDDGTAANCTLQATPGTGTNASCSLRDAVLEATALGSAAITFDSTKFSAGNSVAQNTITLGSAGPLIPGPYTSIIGPTSGSGPTLKNLVTISGSNTNSILTNSNTWVGLTNLTIANAFGGAVSNSGYFTVTNCTFSNNAYPDPTNGYGGAIFNQGTLTVINSTFSGNSATFGGAIATQTGGAAIQGSTFYNNSAGDSSTPGIGGAIINFNPLTITNSTFTGNSATGQSGAIDNSGPLTLTNTTFSGNTTATINGFENFAPITAANSVIFDFISEDTGGSYTDNGGNVTTPGSVSLAPLALNGGLTKTMIPLPGSTAICAGTLANGTAAGIAADQRGLPFDPRCASGQVDSGAVQANYALAFTRQPPASAIAGVAMSPGPIVGLTESGAAATAATTSVAMTDNASLLGGSDTVNLAAGSANFSNLVISTATSNDILTATLMLSPSISLTAHASTKVTVTTAPAALSNPAPGSVLTGPAVTFSWSAVTGATAYQLWIGSTGVNTNNVYSSGVVTATSVMPLSLPLNGEKLYVRLYTETSGTWYHNDYTYTAAAPATLSAPAPGTLPGPLTTFTWTAPAGAGAYQLWLGTTGVNSNNLFSSGLTHSNTTTRTTMPTNGEKIYARVYTDFGGTWVHSDYVFTAALQSAPVSPAIGSTLAGLVQTFTWSTPTGANADAYEFWLGSTGVASNDVYSSGILHSTSVTRMNLPTNGETLYARLYTDYNGIWVHQDYTLIAATMAMTAPAQGSTLPGPVATFTWTAPAGASAYQLWLGSTGVNTNDIYSSGILHTNSVTRTTLPIAGGTIYARLYTDFSGTWTHVDYTFTAAKQAVIISPEPFTAVPGTVWQFHWSAATGNATQYQLWVGSTGVGSNNLYSSGAVTATTETVTLPSINGTIYVRLYTNFNGTWVHTDWSNTEQ